MKGGIPFVLKRNADRSRFYRLVLHLQKSISGTAKTFKLLWLCPDSLFNRSRIHRLPFRFPNHFIGVQKKLREINR